MAVPRVSWPDRFGALCGTAYVVLILLPGFISGHDGPAHPDGAWVLSDAKDRAGSAAAQVGLAMELLAFMAMLIFIGWFCTLLRRPGGPSAWLGTSALVGAVTALAVKIASAMPVLALWLDYKHLSPEAAQVLNDMNGAAFVVTFMPFGVFMLCAGLALLSSGLLGRVAGWTAVVIGAAGIVVTAVTRADPVATNPIPFLLGLVWILVVSIRLAVAGPRVEREGVATSAVPAHA
jgi:hypothetical protein